MSGFSNTVLGGVGTLIRKFIKSENYVAGISGWSISKDGAVEFNTGTFRGKVEVYDVNGVLVAKISAVNGVEIFTPAGDLMAMRVNTVFGTGGPKKRPEFMITPVIAGQTVDYGAISSSNDTLNNNRTDLTLTPPAVTGRARPTLSLSSRGAVGSATNINLGAEQITTAGPVNLNGEVWNALPYINAWTDFSPTYVAGQFKKKATNDVHIMGISNVGVRAAIMAILPVGYRPNKIVRVPITAGGGGVPAGITPWMDIDTNGYMTPTNYGPTTTTIEFDAVFSLDSL